MTKKVFLFDIDGVIVPEGDVFLRDRLIKEHGIEPEKTNPFFYVDFYRCLVGKADIYDKLPQYFEEWGWRGTVDDLLDFWFSGEKDLDRALLNEVTKLRRAGYQCYIASNQEKHRADYLLNTVDLKRFFDGWFFSHEIGHMKDSKKYFEAVLSKLGRPSKEVIFWDNVYEYVKMAHSAGIEAYLYKGLKEYLRISKLIEATREDDYEGHINSVKVLALQLFLREPLSIERIKRGKMNRVFKTEIPDKGTFIFQLNPQMERRYIFEQSTRVASKAFHKGIPTHEYAYWGNQFIPYAWMVYEMIEGIPGDEYSGNKEELWRKIGEIAARINGLSMPGFGAVIFWEKERFYRKTWKEEVDFMKSQYKEARLFEPDFVFSGEEIRDILEEVEAVRGWQFSPSLIHGNLSLDNVLVDKKGDLVGVIDWDQAFGGRAPHQEIASIFPWYINEREKKAFLEGYGLRNEEWSSIKRDLTRAELLVFLSALIWYVYFQNKTAIDDMAMRVRSNLNFLKTTSANRWD